MVIKTKMQTDVRREREGSTLEKGPGAGKLNRILGGEVRDETGSTGK